MWSKCCIHNIPSNRADQEKLEEFRAMSPEEQAEKLKEARESLAKAGYSV